METYENYNCMKYNPILKGLIVLSAFILYIVT